MWCLRPSSQTHGLRSTPTSSHTCCCPRIPRPPFQRLLMRWPSRSGSSHIAGQRRQVVDISCVLATLDEVFEDFIAAVLERAATMPSAPVAALAAVLHDWKTFLAAGSRPPSISGLAGIVGELLVVADLTGTAPAAVRAWSHARHDFRSRGDAVEVKTTLSPTSYAVTIHGEDQLQEPSGGTLHLHFIRLEATPGTGQSVASLTDMLLTRGVPAEPLYAGLLAAGIALVDLQASAEITFDVRQRFTLPVGKDFPRIVASSFVGGGRPPGVDRLTYQVDLDRLRDAALDVEDWHRLTGVMAAGVA